MKIAISSTGRDLESNVSLVFGRADYFIIIDTEVKGVVDVVDNSYAKNCGKGAGVAAATLVAQSGVEMVFSGKIGPTADMVLKESLISATPGVSGRVCEVLNKIYSLCNK